MTSKIINIFMLVAVLCFVASDLKAQSSSCTGAGTTVLAETVTPGGTLTNTGYTNVGATHLITDFTPASTGTPYAETGGVDPSAWNEGGCGAGFAAGQPVYFEFTPNLTGTYCFDVTNPGAADINAVGNDVPGGGSFDSEIAVFSGACGSLVELASNDDAVGLNAGVCLALTAGTTYIVVVDGASYFETNTPESCGEDYGQAGTSVGSFDLDVTSPAVAPSGVCGDSFTYCYDNGETDNVIWEVCPTNPGEAVSLIINAGSFEASFDILEVYTGPAGSGNTGTQIFGNWGDLTGTEMQSFQDECLILVVSSDGTSVSCADLSETELSVSTSCLVACAETCAEAATDACNAWVTPDDTFAASYDEIALNGGESCFPSLDASAGTVSQTLCYNYVATTPSFVVLPGTSTIEYEDVDGNECDQSISNITVYSDGPGCATPVDITATNQFDGATPGNTYVVCVTGEAGQGAAEGVCALECIVNSITPLAPPPCDDLGSLIAFLGDCDEVTFAIGFPANADGTVTGVPNADPNNYTYTVSSPIAGTQSDNIGFFDTDADGNGDFLGNIITYTADQLAQGCAAEAFPVTIDVVCTDGSGFATIDFGTGPILMDDFDPYAPFALVPNLYPDVANFTVTEVTGACGVPAMVTITAPNGDVCYTETGTAPTQPACDSGLTNSEPLTYNQTFGDSSGDVLLNVDCSATFANTLAADCAAVPCAAVCDLTGVTAAAPVCSGDGTTYSVDVSWTGGPDASVSLADANATITGDSPATVANGTATFTYTAGTAYSITVTDTEGLCVFGPFAGAAPNCTIPCNAEAGTICPEAAPRNQD